ncbi:hypothetical protein C8Q72DRAFT_949974 [Fomitopsis betulina]|nr:hypothetical protein C8Q72DRAFT_949974 [Fomitopsis betulina]
MSAEDHWIVLFVATAVSLYTSSNEPALRDPYVASIVKPTIADELTNCAKTYQGSEPYFHNHPIARKVMKSGQRKLQSIPAPIVGPPLVGTSFSYQDWSTSVTHLQDCRISDVAGRW